MKRERHEVFAAAVDDSEVDFRRLVQLLKRGAWWVVGASVLGAVVGIAIAVSLPNRYQVVSVLTPVSDNARAAGGLSSMIGQLGGLASAAGIALPGGGNSEAALTTLQSPAFLAAFIREEGIKPVLFPKQWDPEARAWRPRPAPSVTKQWLLGMINDPMQSSLSKAPTEEPSDYAAAKYFKETILSVSEDKRSELITVTVSWTNPEQATRWSADLVRRLNATVRETMMADADRSIAYLRQQAQITPEVGVRDAIYGLMEAKLKSRMVAAVNDEVAFRVVDRPLVPTIPSGPHRALIVLGLAMLGAILVLSYILARENARSD